MFNLNSQVQPASYRPISWVVYSDFSYSDNQTALRRRPEERCLVTIQLLGVANSCTETFQGWSSFRGIVAEWKSMAGKTSSNSCPSAEASGYQYMRPLVNTAKFFCILYHLLSWRNCENDHFTLWRKLHSRRMLDNEKQKKQFIFISHDSLWYMNSKREV